VIGLVLFNVGNPSGREVDDQIGKAGCRVIDWIDPAHLGLLTCQQRTAQDKGHLLGGLADNQLIDLLGPNHIALTKFSLVGL